jgi:hypothetical protein
MSRVISDELGDYVTLTLALPPAKLQYMNISDLSANQLRRAASIKDEIEKLYEGLSSILGAGASTATAHGGRKQKRRVSAATRAKMAAAQRRRWAAKPKAKRTMSAAAKKKLSEFQKARWAKIKAAQKK